MKQCFLIAALVILARIPTSAETFNNYSGTVNGNTTIFNLCWLGDSVVGTFVRDANTFTLAGDNSRQGQIFMAVAYLGRTVAYINVHKSTSEGKVIWQGSMRIEETGDIIPVEFSRTKS